MANKDIDKLVKDKLNDLLSPVDLTLIVSYKKETKQILIGGQPIEAGRANNLKAEAEFLLNSGIWKLIYETPKALAERAMFVDGDSLDDLKKGRSILYTLSTQKNIVDMLKALINK